MHSTQCPRCGAQNRPSAKFCKQCQSPLLVNVTMKTCPNCQVPNRMNARFCSKCGHVFSLVPKTTLAANLPQFLQSRPLVAVALGGAAVLLVVSIAVLVFGLALRNGQSTPQAANRPAHLTSTPIRTPASPTSETGAVSTAVPTPTGALAITTPASTNATTPAVLTPTRALLTATPLFAGDGLEQAKRGTVFIAVPLDATPGKMVSGSGSVITKRGHILTNNHLFVDDNGKAYNARGEIQIGFPPRNNLKGDVEYYYRAILVRADVGHDLALLRITATTNGGPLPADLGLNVIPLGDSDQLDIGDPVTILGYPGLGGDTLTLTRGAISGFLPDEGYIKTDAEINPGNSGGPAFNMAYEQIGIASAVFVSKSQTVPGKIGWIRPINFAKPLIDLAKREAGE